MNTLERQNQRPVEIRENEDGSPPDIIGTAAVFFDEENREGTEYKLWDGAVERIMPTAFDSALEQNHDVVGVVGHDNSRLLGRTSAGTMVLSKTADGLAYRIKGDESPVHEQARANLRRGELAGSSFKFYILDETWSRSDDGLEVREIRDVLLVDVGPVVNPAYSGTSAGLLREAAIQEAREAREKIVGKTWRPPEKDLRRIEAFKRTNHSLTRSKPSA